jgi:hypothetical protein
LSFLALGIGSAAELAKSPFHSALSHARARRALVPTRRIRAQETRGEVRAFDAHEPRAGGVKTRGLAPCVDALPCGELIEEL